MKTKKFFFHDINKLYALIFAILSFTYLFITPPFQVPDEFAHFFRAYQISEGQFLGYKIGKDSGGELPAEVHSFAVKYMHIPFHPETKISLHDFIKTLKSSPELADSVISNRKFIPFNNTVLYSPVSYFPQSLGILIATFFKSKIIICFYVARFFSALFSIFIFYLTLKILNFSKNLKNLFFVIAILPMFLFESCSISADATLYFYSFMLSAIALRLQWRWEKKFFTIYCIFASLLSLSKVVYFPLSLIIFITILNRELPATMRAA